MKVNRKRLREVVTITLEREEEDSSYTHGRFDDVTVCDWIREQLQMGNGWAWCTAHVIVELGDLKGEDWLGACSYASEASFRSDGYFESMVDDAVEELAKAIEKITDVHGLFKIEDSLCLQCVVAA